MEKFTASNGLTVSVEPDDDIFIGGVPGVGGKVGLVGLVTKALREFFQHERDQELGRWRWPENPDLMVYKVFDKTGKDTGMVRVASEATGFGIGEFSRSVAKTGVYGEAARAYFAAHPEPKPWHDAEPGEVWVLSVDGSEDMVMTVHESKYGGFRFRLNDREGTIFALDTPVIRAGRRIWPEVSDV